MKCSNNESFGTLTSKDAVEIANFYAFCPIFHEKHSKTYLTKTTQKINFGVERASP